MKTKKKSLTKLTFENFFYNSFSTFIAKFGGFFLTIILARVLLPELFGVYSLVLSIITIVFSFSDLGINETAVRYVSDALGRKNKKKASSYFFYLLKIKSLLIFAGAFILLSSSHFFSYNVFNNPKLFLPIIAATFYIVINSFRSFFATLFYALKDLRDFPVIYLVLHGSKLLFSVIALLIFSGVSAIFAVFIAFSASSFITLVFIIFIFNKKYHKILPKEKVSIDKKRILRYLTFVGISNLSLVVFGSVDTVMLGKFVESSYVGYYQVAFSLIASLTAFFSISGVFIPAFTQVHGDRLKKALTNSFRYITIISIPAVVGLIFISDHIIFLFYGPEYLPATAALYLLSLLLLITPNIELYSSLFKAKEKTKFLATIVFISLIINIILNYFLITYLLEFGQVPAILGAAAATLISRGFYFLALFVNAKLQFEIKMNTFSIFKSSISSGIMAIVLFVYNLYININLFTGVLEIITGILVYLTAMVFVKGIVKEDFNLFLSFFKKIN